MANRTPRFGFTTFDSPTDTLATQGYKAFGADRELLERLLTYAVEKHRHNGATLTATRPEAPRLTVNATGGALLPNQTVYYCASIVDAHGQEQMASRVALAYTPPQVIAPVEAPSVSLSESGSLLPGDYIYVLSAYTDTNDRETLAGRAGAGSLTAPGGFHLDLPNPPSGATGWNVYRKGPTDYEPMYITSIPIDTGPFVDSGALDASRLRSTPVSNTTSTSASIIVDLPAALPAGYTVRIYRTYDRTDWDDSLLTWSAAMPFVDVGHATRPGYPPASSMGLGGAPKIELGANTTGALPSGLTTPAVMANFTFEGPTAEGVGSWQWVNEYDTAATQTMRAALGRGSSPAEQPVIVGLDYRPSGGTWHRLLTSGLDDATAEIAVGETIGALTPLPEHTLAPGDALRAIVLQAGGGATPTDEDLSIVVTLAVQHGSTTQTYTWES